MPFRSKINVGIKIA